MVYTWTADELITAAKLNETVDAFNGVLDRIDAEQDISIVTTNTAVSVPNNTKTYVANSASRLEFTLPASAAVGLRVHVGSKSTGGWRILSNSGQVIYYANSAAPGGVVDSTDDYAFITLLCVTANTDWVVSHLFGAYSVTIPGSNSGYWGGGTGGAGYSSEIDGLLFFDESAVNPAATLAVARQRLAGVQSSTKGYFGGGYDGSDPSATMAEIDGILFFDKTAINPAATLATGRRSLGGVSASAKGYWGGGYSNATSYTTEIDGIQYSDESAVNPAAALNTARWGLAGVQSSTKGYFGGGANGGGELSEIDGLQFSDESAVNPTATLSGSRSYVGGTSSSAKGYWGGGFNGTASTTEIDGLQFSDESAINPAVALSVARQRLAGVQSSTKGYFGGGSGGPDSSEIDGLQFSDESTVNPAATLALAREHLGAVSAA